MFTWSIPTNSKSTILKVNNRNNRNSSEKCETCSKLAIRTPERCHWNFFSERNHRSKAFKVMESRPHSHLEDFEIYPRYSTVSFSRKWNWINLSSTAWKVSKYGDFSGPYLPAFALNTEIHSEIPYSAWMRENADQKKLRIWTLFAQWSLEAKYKICLASYHMTINLGPL